MSVPQSFLCPITAEIMADPVSTSDGFSYEREAITEWFATGHDTSPLTGVMLSRTALLPNHALRQAIQQYVDEHPERADELYRPRDAHKIRTTIETKQWAPIAVAAGNDGLPPMSSSSAAAVPSAGVAVTSSETPTSVPMGFVVAEAVRPPPTPALRGLTGDDRSSSTPFAVADWKAHCALAMAPGRPASSGWFSRRKEQETSTAASAHQPILRASIAEGGGTHLQADVSSAQSLLVLARHLAAPGSSPLSALTITAQDGFGPGTAAPLEASGEGFELLCRALAASLGGADCLATLRCLGVSKIGMSDAAASRLAEALGGHPSLESLELWNVGLEDAGALSLGRLAAAANENNCPRLASLNLGRNLVSADAREELEAMVSADRVRLRVL